MRKVIASEFVSLDGAMEEPRWTFQFSSAGKVQVRRPGCERRPSAGAGNL